MTERVFSIAASADDGDIVRASAGEWPPTGAFTTGTIATEVLVRKNRFGGGGGEAWTGVLRFDTSTLSDADVVTAATLRVSVTAKAATWQAWATTGTVDVVLGNLSSISTTGTTGLRLSLSGDVQPPLGNDTRVHFASLDHTTRDEPKLIVTTADAPAVNPDYSKFPKAILRRT
jgi:hypothetical protein